MNSMSGTNTSHVFVKMPKLNHIPLNDTDETKPHISAPEITKGMNYKNFLDRYILK